MPIKLLLTLGLVLFLVYASVQGAAPRLIRGAIVGFVSTGIYFVWVPNHSTVVANWLGVGRGADLLLYVWILLSLAVGLNLHFKVRAARRQITELTRAVALMTVRVPDGGQDSAASGLSAPRVEPGRREGDTR